MTKTPFNRLPIYKAIRNSKLTKSRQDEVLRKLKKYRIIHNRPCIESAETLDGIGRWEDLPEGFDYWQQMHNDSGL